MVIAPVQLSVPAGAVYITEAEHWPGTTFAEISVGQVMVGNSLSVTTTENEQVAVWPLAAVTLNRLTVAPAGNICPEARPSV